MRAPPRKRAPAFILKPIPVKPVVENPIADLPFPKFDRGPQVASACTIGLEGAMLRLKELEKRKPGADWLKGWEALYDWEEDQERRIDLPAERASQPRSPRGGREVRAALGRFPGRTRDERIDLPGRQAVGGRAQGSDRPARRAAGPRRIRGLRRRPAKGQAGQGQGDRRPARRAQPAVQSQHPRRPWSCRLHRRAAQGRARRGVEGTAARRRRQGDAADRRPGLRQRDADGGGSCHPRAPLAAPRPTKAAPTT